MALLIAPAYASHALDTTKLLLNQALRWITKFLRLTPEIIGN